MATSAVTKHNEAIVVVLAALTNILAVTAARFNGGERAGAGRQPHASHRASSATRLPEH
jgi:hypothetical protein